jgi:hypothetical protein
MMRNPMTKTMGAAALAAALTLGGASTASAGVTSCSAPGGEQEAGAVIGALVGGVIGNQVGGRHATGETIVGAGVGAAAGSAIGCEAQKSSARNASTYTRGGYRLYSNVQPASYARLGETFVAERSAHLRAAPDNRSARVGRLQGGERFQAMARVRGTDWILVGREGVGVGYVRGDSVRPADHRYARY